MRWSLFSTQLLAVFIFTKPGLTVPDPLITPKPKAPAFLQQRQDDSGPNVYGYINGDVDSPMACGAGYQWFSSSSNGGCCNQFSCTGMVFTCYDNSDAVKAADICGEGLCNEFFTVLQCKSPEPYCFRYMVITDAQDNAPAYIHRCGTESTDVTVLVSPTNAAAIQTSKASSRASLRPGSATATKTQGSSSEPTSDSNSPSTDQTQSSATKGSIWKYAVIGLGVIVGLSLLGIVFWLLMRGQKNKKVVQEGIVAANGPIPMQYKVTEDGSVAGEMPIEQRMRTQEWTRSQSRVSPLGAVSAHEREHMLGRY